MWSFVFILALLSQIGSSTSSSSSSSTTASALSSSSSSSSTTSATDGAHGEGISFDSDEEGAPQEGFGGISLDVWSDNGAPFLIIHHDADIQYAICFQFDEMFEGTAVDLVERNWDVDSDSKVDFKNDMLFEYTQLTPNTGRIVGIPDPGEDKVRHRFSELVIDLFLGQEAGGDLGQYGIKYSYNLLGYVWQSTDPTAKYMVEIDLKDCSSEYGGDVNSDPAGNVTRRLRRMRNRRRRRRLSRSLLKDGVQDDDSQEVDVGNAQFLNTPTAQCRDSNNGTFDIAVGVVYKTSKIFLAWDNFDGCYDMYQDPWFTIVNAKMGKGAATIHAPSAIAFVVSVVMSAIITAAQFI
jgi:hypothetical protein